MSLVAARCQKSASSTPPGVSAALTSQAATRRALAQSSTPLSGVHPAEGRPVASVGSYSQTLPRVLRHPTVSATRSSFTLVASTGPCHSRMAGTAKPVVLLVWVGPITQTEWRFSVATRRRPE